MLNLTALFEPMHFVENLRYMGLGMLGIFIVIGVIMLLTMLLNKLTEQKDQSGEDNKGA
ncbi:MAG: oxaloacetate decarboxylase [Oscillospiraceae bacterium]|nr:oxaloacetate decarboxylase [Oscillospiraceae bacterium]